MFKFIVYCFDSNCIILRYSLADEANRKECWRRFVPEIRKMVSHIYDIDDPNM